MGSQGPLPLTTEHARVRVDDGVELSVLIHRPAVDGRFPCIVSYTPYRKGSGLGDSFQSFAEKGYVIVIFDVRGTGESTGVCTSVYSAEERSDGYFMVEWCARQPWCDGNVGMWGISYGAVVSLQMAQAGPPHLKAIIARCGTDDPYAEWTNPGGSPRNYMYEMYATFMTARNFAPPDPAELGDRWESAWAKRLEGNVPWGISFVENMKDGPFWRERAVRGRLGNVSCAVFVVDGWADWYNTPMLGIFAQLKGPRRALIGPWSHQWPHIALPGPRIDWEHEALKWWDYWLKGIDTGVMQEPPLTLFVREHSKPQTFIPVDSGSFRAETEWPSTRTADMRLYLAGGSQLIRRSPASDAGTDESDEYCYVPDAGVSAGKQGGGPFRYNCLMPLDQRADESHSVVYTSEVLPRTIYVVGRPRVRLFVSSNQPVAQTLVRLCDVAPDGTSVLISRGFLNLTAREYPARPPSELEPGKVYEIDMQLLACAYELQSGHRIRLMLSGADFLNMWPPPRHFATRVFRDSKRSSYLELPTLGEMAPAALRPLTGDTPPALPPVRFIVGKDVINETLLYEFENTLFGNKARFEVSLRDPAVAQVVSEASFACRYGETDYLVSAVCRTSSDSAYLRHEADVSILRDGKPYWTRKWTARAPRECF
jgi:putative CocE/NonD family hydrolase